MLLRRRISEVEGTQRSVGKEAGRSQAWVSSELLGDTQRVVKHLWVNEPDTLERLASALEWSVPELVEQVGVALPRSAAPVSEVGPSSLKTIPVYDASSPVGGGLVVGETAIPANWKGEHRAYRVEGEGAELVGAGSTVIVRMDAPVELGNTALGWCPQTGMLLKTLNVSSEEERRAVLVESPNYAHIFFGPDCWIIGRVVEVRRPL